MTTRLERKKNEQRIRELASSRHEFTAANIDVLIGQLQEAKEDLPKMHPFGSMNLLLGVALATAELKGMLFMGELVRTMEKKDLANHREGELDDLPDPPDPPRSKSGSPESAGVPV